MFSARAKHLVSLAVLAVVALMAARIAGQTIGNQLVRLLGHADPACGMRYCDAALFWLAGRLSRAGDFTTLYDAGKFLPAAARILPGQSHYLPFLYPPVMLLPAAALSYAGLATGYAIATTALTTASCWLLRQTGLTWRVIGLGLVSPAGLWAIYLGQCGVIGCAILAAGLMGAQKRPLLGGMLLSLLACKPQYALLVPVALLASRQWRALAWFGAGISSLVGLSVLCFGRPAWTSYLGSGRAAAQSLLQAPFGPGYEQHGASVFWMLRSLGAGLPLAYAVQAAALLLSAALLWWLWRGADSRRLPLTLCLMLLATPYGFTDDMVGYSLAAAMLVRPDTRLRNAALAILWIAPGFTGHLAAATGVLITPILVLAMVGFGLAIPASPAIAGHRSGSARSGWHVRSHSPR